MSDEVSEAVLEDILKKLEAVSVVGQLRIK
jgi:hypothetical protein